MGLFFNKETGAKLCALLHSHYDVTDQKRKSTAQYVIEKGTGMNDPLAWLACAFAYTYLGAEYRKNAITQFEQYLSSPVKCADYDLYTIYLTLAELYEADYNLAAAEQFYIFQEQEFRKNPKTKAFDPLPNVKLGRLYLKISTAKAVDYWQALTRSSDYKKYPTFKRSVDVELANAKEKHDKGYVYKPKGGK